MSAHITSLVQFLLLLFVGALVYVAAGMALNRKRGESGLAMLPNRTFWQSVPGLVLLLAPAWVPAAAFTSKG